MDTEKRFDIVAGPGKDVLIDAFKYAYTEGAKIPLSFTIIKEKPFEDSKHYSLLHTTDYVINSISHEDGSGESFEFSGSCRTDLDSRRGEIKTRYYKFKAYYSTKRRAGYITFSD